MAARVKNAIVKLVGIILGVAVLGAVVGGGIAALRPESYTSTTTVMVAPSRSLPNEQTETVSQYILSSMPTYNNLAMTTAVLQGAADHGQPTDAIAKNLKVEVPAGSSLVKLEYSDSDEQRSTQIADDLAAGLRDSIRQFSPQTNGTSQVDVSIVQKGAEAVGSDKPSISRWALVGGTVGAVLGLAAAQAFMRRRTASASHEISTAPSRRSSLSS